MPAARPIALAVCVATLLLSTSPLRSQGGSPPRERTGAGGAAIVLGLPPPDSGAVPSHDDELMASGYWARDPDNGALYRTDRLVVRFKEAPSSALRAHALDMAGVDRRTGQLWDGWEQVSLLAGTTAPEARARLLADPAVAEVLPEYRVEALATRPNDELFGRQWNFEALDLPRAWDVNDGGNDRVVVAVLDTGLNVQDGVFTYNILGIGRVPLQFSAAADLVAPGRLVAPKDFIYGDEIPLDVDGHGTHVAGTIAQLTGNGIGVSGIAHKARLMPVKVLDGTIDFLVDPSNDGGLSTTIAAGIRYAADNGAHVINLSLGSTGAMPLVRDAIGYAVQRGAFVAIAAGNDGDDGNPVEYPAAYGADIDGAMTVGAVGRDLRRASYSGFKAYVEICAPGGDDVSSENDLDNGVAQMTYRAANSWASLSWQDTWLLLGRGFRPRFDTFAVTAYQGTSMAAPHVAGVAALLYAQGFRNPATVERAIKTFARPLDARPDECGAGLVDPRGALRGLGMLR